MCNTLTNGRRPRDVMRIAHQRIQRRSANATIVIDRVAEVARNGEEDSLGLVNGAMAQAGSARAVASTARRLG